MRLALYVVSMCVCFAAAVAQAQLDAGPTAASAQQVQECVSSKVAVTGNAATMLTFASSVGTVPWRRDMLGRTSDAPL